VARCLVGGRARGKTARADDSGGEGRRRTGRAAHGLARGEVADEVTVSHHLAHGEGEGQRDGQGQSLGDRHDDDRHGEHEEANEDRQVDAPVPRRGPGERCNETGTGDEGG